MRSNDTSDDESQIHQSQLPVACCSDSPDDGSSLTKNRPHADVHAGAPVRPDEEWANAATHSIACAGTVLLGATLLSAASAEGLGLTIACGLYLVSVFGTFAFSTLSHSILRQPMLNTLRAWDQAMIYAMISGTYTPIIYRFAPDAVRMPLLIAIWVAALTGIAGKLLMRHRVNNITTVGYLLLGWLPAIPMYGHVPSAIAWGTLLGGVLYSLGVLVLMNDGKAKYLHALWHLMVMSAALCHFLVIRWYVVG
ncbi:hemolysin III [Roseiconus nitratireducens]|uniref:Hemolysin III n=2 Tax=Roseiconus nitratireducens TaxID=2605748 RepID=A0A5M6CYJ2_9BACT|nr:hemolysin III [Roseiconus nitratireducens]